MWVHLSVEECISWVDSFDNVDPVLNLSHISISGQHYIFMGATGNFFGLFYAEAVCAAGTCVTLAQFTVP